MIVNFLADADKPEYDDIYLSNFATIYVKDELLRVEGVSDISYQGERDYSIRAWLDPQKLASRKMTAIDVANAIKDQNADAPSRLSGPGRPHRTANCFQLPIDTLGCHLSQPEQFRNIIVKPQLTTSVGARATAAAPPVLGNGGDGEAAGRRRQRFTSSTTASTTTSTTTGSTSGNLLPTVGSTSTTSGGATGAMATTSSSPVGTTGGASTAGGTTAGGSTTGGGATGGGGSRLAGGGTFHRGRRCSDRRWRHDRQRGGRC